MKIIKKMLLALLIVGTFASNSLMAGRGAKKQVVVTAKKDSTLEGLAGSTVKLALVLVGCVWCIYGPATLLVNDALLHCLIKGSAVTCSAVTSPIVVSALTKIVASIGLLGIYRNREAIKGAYANLLRKIGG